MFTEVNLFLTSGTSNQESQADKKATTISTTTSPLQKGVIDLMISYKLLIFLRKEKAKKNRQLSPLYLRITCEKRTEISLNKWINPDNWNPEKQRLKGNSPKANAINSFLKTVEVKFHEIHRRLFDKGELITADEQPSGCPKPIYKLYINVHCLFCCLVLFVEPKQKPMPVHSRS